MYHVIPDSHFFTDLNQITYSIGMHLKRLANTSEEVHYVNEPLDKEYLLIGLHNCIKNGYEIKRLDEPQGGFSSPVFKSVVDVINYLTEKELDSRQNYIDFSMVLENTMHNGFNLTNGLKMEKREAYKVIDGELEYQGIKWTERNILNGIPDEEKPVAEWLTYIEFHMLKAKNSIYHLNKEEALAEIRKVTALGVKCMMVHGCPERKLPVQVGGEKDINYTNATGVPQTNAGPAMSNEGKQCSCDDCDCKK